MQLFQGNAEAIEIDLKQCFGILSANPNDHDQQVNDTIARIQTSPQFAQTMQRLWRANLDEQCRLATIQSLAAIAVGHWWKTENGTWTRQSDKTWTDAEFDEAVILAIKLGRDPAYDALASERTQENPDWLNALRRACNS
jgi:hypothetical protein